MEKLKRISAQAVSLGAIQTLRTAVETEHGFVGEVTLPWGISVGSQEPYLMPAARAAALITNEIAPRLIGQDVLEQRQFDQWLIEADNSADRHVFGSNTLLSVSLATCRAAAAALQKPLHRYIAALTRSNPSLPKTIIVILEGGKHAEHIPTWNQTIQEFSVVAPPEKADEITINVEKILRSQNVSLSRGQEGGTAGVFVSNGQAAAALALAASGFPLAFDIAASHSFILLQEIESLIRQFRISLIEDPLPEDDLSGWRQFTASYGIRHVVAADDLTVGDPAKMKYAVRNNLANCLVIKLNQSATLSEIFDLIALSQMGNWSHMVSHRGLETMDTFIVDLAVGTGAKFLKAGNPRQPQRKVKYDRLAEIAAQMS